MNRAKKPKDNDAFGLTIKSKHSKNSNKSKITPFDEDTNMSLRDLEDESDGTKGSPFNNKVMEMADLAINRRENNGTFIETEMSQRDKQDDDVEFIVHERKQKQQM